MAPPLVLLPAMLCDERLYRSQAAALRDLVEPLPLIVAEADLALAVDVVLREAPTRFVLAGTSYGGNLALEVARAAPARVLGLWLMGCNPGLPGDLDAGRSRSRRVQAGEFEAVLDELASGIGLSGMGPAPPPPAVHFGSWPGASDPRCSFDRTPPCWDGPIDGTAWPASPARRCCYGAVKMSSAGSPTRL